MVYGFIRMYLMYAANLMHRYGKCKYFAKKNKKCFHPRIATRKQPINRHINSAFVGLNKHVYGRLKCRTKSTSRLDNDTTLWISELDRVLARFHQIFFGEFARFLPIFGGRFARFLPF
jgi:hypothetical protein